jgi:RNA polymerase sigma-70 factor (ECF subfamily)
MAPSMTSPASTGNGLQAPPSSDAPKARARDTFERDLVALIPHLRSFSRTVCGREGIAEDMAQEALAKAWRSRDRFAPGTNLKAWLFTILRNEFYSHQRRAWRQMQWNEELGEQIPAPADEQLWTVDLSDCARALTQLPKSQRDAVLLIGAGGFSYEDAAGLLGVAVGTMKSRRARGRERFAEIFSGQRSMPLRTRTPARSGMEEIFGQLTALQSAGTDRAAQT